MVGGKIMIDSDYDLHRNNIRQNMYGFVIVLQNSESHGEICTKSGRVGRWGGGGGSGSYNPALEGWLRNKS